MIILVAFGAMLVGSIVWYRVTSGNLDDKSASVETALRSKWSPVDLGQLSEQYRTETDIDRKVALFPQPKDAFFFTATFSSLDRVVAAYRIDAGAGERCLIATVTGPVPNRVHFDERGGDC